MRQYLDLKWLSLLLLNLLVLFLSIKHKPLPISNPDLSSLNQQISAIQTQLKRPIDKPNLSLITQNLKQLNESIQSLKNKDDHHLDETITAGQLAIKQELKGISELLQHLDDQKHPIKMLPASELPFSVLSIDSLQEIPVASIAYQYKTHSLEKNDSLDGWTILQINFAKQLIEFENADKAHVAVHLNQEVNHD